MSNKVVLQHLMKYGSITVPQAKEIYKIKHLAARIKDLRDEGYVISHTTYKDKDMYGIDQRHSKYVLLDLKKEAKKDACKGCFHWRNLGTAQGSIKACHYILDVGHRRPCPPGEGCTEYTKERRMTDEQLL